MELFYQFHNVVNARKGFAIFPRSELETKYEKANTIEIIRNFLFHFKDKTANIPRNISHDFFRQRAFTQISDWLQANYQHFM